jgi:signal transduction histidine kinase
MNPSEDIDLLKDKIKALEHALEKQPQEKGLKTIVSKKAANKTGCTVSISLLSKLINSTVDGVIAADKTGSLLVFNEAAVHMEAGRWTWASAPPGKTAGNPWKCR